MKIYLFAKVLSVLFVLIFIVNSNSLQVEAVTSLFTTPRASKVGDTLTVIISEFSTASQTAKTDFDRKSKTDSEVSLPSTSLPSFSTSLPSLGWDYSSGYGGSGSTQRKASILAKLTVEVIEVLPNGNLKVRGEKKVKVNQEEQIIYLEGIVRPQDIGENNTISSVNIAQVNIRYEGRGPITEARRPGLITRLFSWLRIF
ncbi:flagellar basal body L-ring protein FlgH [Candidatus Aerophobetes bacterium]|nr:flagellar basal body L-ring protein FlgH [Candidatus Aerophobetes bacterium]